MLIEFADENSLLRRIKNEERISFLLGSALTAKKGDIGIPNVEEMLANAVSFIEESDPEDIKDYNAFLEKNGTDNRYQDTFSFIIKNYGIKEANNIVKNAVLSNIDKTKNKHKITKSVNDLVNKIKDETIIVDNIITTNFDTIIEEKFKEETIPYNGISIVTDSNINDNNNGFTNIIHIHGVWDRNDTMHTQSQLKNNRDKIESSLKRLLSNNVIVVMGYSGWDDSFMRSIASIVNDDKAEYSILWCFYEKDESKIKNRELFFKNLKDAISRERVTFYKGINCDTFFEKLKKKEIARGRTIKIPLNYFYIEEDNSINAIRNDDRKTSISILNNNKSLHLESEIGSGRFGFIYSIIRDIEHKHIFRVDMSEVISKSQLEERFRKDTGVDITFIMEQSINNKSYAFFLIFDNITNNTNQETLNFLKSLPNTLDGFNQNLFFIFTSPAKINQFSDISVKLNPLTVNDSEILIRTKLPQKTISDEDIQKIHDKSEGLVTKLETIIRYLSSCSVREVIESNDIFKNIMNMDNISQTVLKKIGVFESDSSHKETFMLMKILSILKNGESITNIKKSTIGKNITIDSSLKIVESGLASSIDIDSSTTIVKLNPLVKDFIYSKLKTIEIELISNEFIGILIKRKKDSIYISSTNRKIIEHGYNTDGDNIVELLINESNKFDKQDESDGKKSSLSMILYYSRAYLYSLSNSSKFKELISASLKLMGVINDKELSYEYYCYLSSAYRMLGEDETAKKYLDLALEKTPINNKYKLSEIRADYILYYNKVDYDKSIELAKRTKKEFKSKTLAYITAEEILALDDKNGNEKTKKLIRIESKARRLGFDTAANNILFHLSDGSAYNNKVISMNKVLETDSSEYNKCRAFIYKMDAMLKNDKIDQITDDNISSLSNIYNYLFHQRIDVLFNKCINVLWGILERKNKIDVIIYIYTRGVLIWRLNDDFKNEEEYSKRLGLIYNNSNNNILLNSDS